MTQIQLNLAIPRRQKHSVLDTLQAPGVAEPLALRLVMRWLALQPFPVVRILALAPAAAHAGDVDHPAIRELTQMTQLTPYAVVRSLGPRHRERTVVRVFEQELTSICAEVRDRFPKHGQAPFTELIAIVRAAVWSVLCLPLIKYAPLYELLGPHDRADRQKAIEWGRRTDADEMKFMSEDDGLLQDPRIPLTGDVDSRGFRQVDLDEIEATDFGLPEQPEVSAVPKRASIFAGVERAVVDRIKAELPIVITDADES